MRRATDAILKEIGKTRDDLPNHEEPPLPIIPPLAENKGELFGGLFLIALILSIFILSWTGMFKKWFME